MQYKRTEYFRFTFHPPLDAEFRIFVENGTVRESSPGYCQLLDMSPGGAKMITKFDIPLEQRPVTIRLHFTLVEEPLDVKGRIVWKKTDPEGFLYGVDLTDDPVASQLIITELKTRQRKMLHPEKQPDEPITVSIEPIEEE